MDNKIAGSMEVLLIEEIIYFVKPIHELEPSIHWLELGNIERWLIFCEDSTPYPSLSALDANYTEF